MNITVMPLQPIKDYRFVSNRIVEKLLEVAPIGLNEIACMDFTNEEREQFAQLIGYSLGGYSELNYVSDESYEAASNIADHGVSEQTARLMALRLQMEEIRKGLKIAASSAFKIHPDDLES